jgi:hypothetical protein
VGKEEGGWAGGLKGRGEELRVWEVFLKKKPFQTHISNF